MQKNNEYKTKWTKSDKKIFKDQLFDLLHNWGLYAYYIKFFDNGEAEFKVKNLGVK